MLAVTPEQGRQGIDFINTPGPGLVYQNDTWEMHLLFVP